MVLQVAPQPPTPLQKGPVGAQEPFNSGCHHFQMQKKKKKKAVVQKTPFYKAKVVGSHIEGCRIPYRNTTPPISLLLQDYPQKTIQMKQNHLNTTS